MQERMNDEMETIDLLEIMRVLWKKAWLILLCACIGGGIMAAYTKLLVTPMYSSTATIYMLGNGTAQISVGDLSLGTQLQQDFIRIIKSKTTLRNVLKEVGLEGQMSYGALAANVAVTNQEGTQFLDITVSNPDPETATTLANALAKEASDRIVTVMNAEKPAIAEKAEKPIAPVSPNVTKNIVLGALVGMVLAMGLLVLLYLMDDTIRTEEDVKKYLGMNVLAALPDAKERRGRKRAA